jgi:hypothetical protein
VVLGKKSGYCVEKALLLVRRRPESPDHGTSERDHEDRPVHLPRLCGNVPERPLGQSHPHL